MKKFALSGLVLVVFSMLSCDRPALHPAPFLDISKTDARLPTFLAWKSDVSGKAFGLFKVAEQGQWQALSKSRVLPAHPFEAIGHQLFYPETSSMVNGIQTTEELLSPGGRYAISMDGVKTFADDLDNARIVVREVARGRLESVTVPALCNGEMFPLFWNPTGALFYFVVSVGDEKGRSFQLWEYRPTIHQFINVGDTNGDIHISQDGAWVIWETGPTVGSTVALCAYDAERKVNYRLNPVTSSAFFQSW